MEMQEILNKVVAHLAQQGVRSIEGEIASTNICAYRGDNGTSCAVGCLISDEIYHPDMEGKWVYTKIVQDALVKAKIFDRAEYRYFDKVRFLRELQYIHDSCDTDQWKESFTALAKEYGLQMPSVDWSKCWT